MTIDRIILENFRVYNGVHSIDLASSENSNVTIISGNNGYGKTSFLTSLVWCLYGKLMADVDDRFRKEIYDSGGYKKYCEKTINRISSDGYFSVKIQFSNILIPYLPCKQVSIKRTYNAKVDKESIEILIDGRPNELTKEVGSEIFINDFILPKEIAKFFFFDAEKIVSLAELRTAEEKKALSYAYAEVLGIKKYLDLKDSLENVRFKLRKKTYNAEDRKRLDKLRKQNEQHEQLINHCQQLIDEKQSEIMLKKAASDKFQERLIRQGTSITLQDLKDFHAIKDNLEVELRGLKDNFKTLLELAPFAIAAKKFNQLKSQIEHELELDNKVVSNAYLKKKITKIKAEIKKNKKQLSLNATKEKLLFDSIGNVLLDNKKKEDSDPLLSLSTEQRERFHALYKHLKNSYSSHFKDLISDIKKRQSSYQIVNRKLTDAESKENDPVIRTIRKDKSKIDSEIQLLEEELLELKVKKTTLQNELKSILKQLSELSKVVGVEKIDKEKDKTTERLSNELDDFIHKLKVSKKASLEKNLLKQLKQLMHKTDFIKNVEVVVDGDLIDIEFYDSKKQLINKDALSKGEQQLYATALLKALIDESNIKFPVFIDSPLQKFDKNHARNIVIDFYPNISNQVVLFPLLEKEINQQEYQWLLPKVGKSYLIRQVKPYSSDFKDIKPGELLKDYRKLDTHVH